MDRSFLSDPKVIAASREFVCIRLTTYEDEAEMAFLKKLYTGGSGEAENTTFAVLEPTTLRPLTRVSRGAQQVFGNAERMAADLKEISRNYAHLGAANAPALPVTLNARLGLDVAASDGQLLVLVTAASAAARADVERRLASLAWSAEFLGRFTYAAASPGELTNVAGAKREDGVLIVEPDAFGLKGKALQWWPASAPEAELAAQLRQALKRQPVSKSMQAHRRAGVQQQAYWETRLPVTDPQEASARARARQQMGKPPQ